MALKKSKGNYRSLSGEIRNLERKGEFLFSVEIWLLNNIVNRNGWLYTNLEEHMKMFAGTPILVAYVNDGKTVGDGHNFKMETDRNGEPAPSFTDATAERIVGAISEDVNDIRIEERDGNKWVVAKGILWRWYAKELVEKIERDAVQGREMSISIETLVTKFHEENGIEIEDEYKILGTTILGDHVMPAVADAHIAALTQKEGFRELKVRAASYDPQNKPQKNNETKGLNKLELFNRPQCMQLQERFNGFIVLCAGRDDNGIHAVLRNDKWELFSYDMAAENETIAPERICSCSASVAFGNGVSMDAYDMISQPVEELSRVNAALESANNKITERDNAITAMKEFEAKRRLSAAKEKAVATLAAFNRDREVKISDDVLKSINADIEAGIYANSVDKDGNWNGDQAVEDKVYAVCGRKVQEMDAEIAKNAKTTRVWDGIGLNNGQHEDGGIESLLAKKGIR